ncbi:ATP-binding protein [Alkalihalobacillus trypoxylicola]|uniref:histidine kinase n=1 Tax=Alkalihalobacillus trypoxylicola TaxID=519424 RepID=A0A161PWT4_9BACI|nr:ATP-binding protein [Alkalihalobacillus trypoxylicola]KYG26562.1 histidine kinase [Alkalihalobacillus trypoxylicola]
MKNWSIQKKLWLSTSIIIVAVTLIFSFLIYFLYENLYIDKQIEFLQNQGEQLTQLYDEEGESSSFLAQIEFQRQLNEPLGVTTIFTNDPMLLSSGSPFDPLNTEELITFEERQKLLDGEIVTLIRSHPHFHQDILGMAFPIIEDNHLSGALFLSMTLSDIYEPFQEIQFYLLVSILSILLIITLTIYRAGHSITKPLFKMKALSSKMAKGDFSQRISEKESVKEFNDLARSFNQLSHSLELVEKKRNEFLANVSHELRTPLSYMKGYIEALQEGLFEKEKGLEIIEKESKRLERIVHDLLDLAQLEGESYPIHKEPIAFSQLIIDVTSSFELVLKKKQITLLQQLDDDMIIFGDFDRLEQVVRNLLDNAIQYSESNKKVRIKLFQSNGHAQLLIEDEGVGIPPEDLSSITERFYRVQKGRTRKAGGTGLGLAIVSQIVKRHSGELVIDSQLQKGTIVTISLPLDSSHEIE